MTPADIAALRVLLARAKAAGWKPAGIVGLGQDTQHIWHQNVDPDVPAWTAEVVVGTGYLLIQPEAVDEWSVPVTSVAQVTAVLELAGALPAADNTALIRRAIADPGQFCTRVRTWNEDWAEWDYETIPAWGARAVVIALEGAR